MTDCPYLPHSNIAYIEQTAPSDYCVVMLHGWMDNAASFTPLLKHFTDVHCIALDFPGHGLSAHRQGYYHFVDYVDDVYRAICELKVNKPIILIGHSLGALVATTYAAAFPEKLLGLVCIDGLGPLSLAEEETTTQLTKAIQQRQAVKPAKGFEKLESAVKLRAQTNGISERNSQLLVERAVIKRGGLWYWRHDQKLKLSSPLRFSESQAENICRAVQHPSLLIAASEHPLLSAEHISHREAWFKQLKTHLLSGGHHLHMQNSVEVARCIKAYIKTIV
ncbi:alpha/beta fold hydrolase [Agarivorans sp. 1_MG-2023]|uniref:alpha/beta fold hydrolase n=1 Tax=Agarivorans sp. 1_MG-2023 TaxID=3062634 RepID=UPI0026E35DB1|nr:alpha/beta hydrolase [Agarivorans sp. 1_MG-2023]MDO6764149.1 alpha/beta hydrolase [Agarivorans sp. 1_MG-2023]